VLKDSYLFAKNCYTWEVTRTIPEKMPALSMFDFVRLELTMFRELSLLKLKKAELKNKYEKERQG
jgi:hypothetical protein